MKRIAAVMLVAACLLTVMSGCRDKSQNFSHADLSLAIDGIAVAENTSIEELLDKLGENYTYSEAVSCVYSGMDKVYQYDHTVIYTYPDGDADHLMEVYCTANTVTSRGVAIGADVSEVEEAYGAAVKETGILRYTLPTKASQYESASLYFETADGKVSAVGFTVEHRTE